MGTTIHTHNGYSVQCGHTHYGYAYYGIALSKVDMSIMDMSIMDMFMIGISTMGPFIMSTPIVGDIKMGVPNMDILRGRIYRGCIPFRWDVIIRSFGQIRANE